MDTRYRYLHLFFAGLVIAAASTSASPLIFSTNLHPPYQTLEDGKLSGYTVQVMRCIGQHLDQDWQFTITPWARGLHKLKAGTISGIFPVYHTSEVGHLSVPLLVERWFWYSTEAVDYLDKNVKIGVVRDSNEHQWLLSIGVTPQVLVAEEGQLTKMLQQGRIEGFISNDLSVAYWLVEQNIDSRHWQQSFIRFSPLHLVLADHPAPTQRWLEDINHWAGQCSLNTTQISDHEKISISRKIHPIIQRLPLADIKKRLGKSHTPLSAQEISRRETRWKEEQFLELNFIDHALSEKLRRFVIDNNEIISEAFVMGEQGETIASSQKISDYWQGDEDKFIESKSLAEGELFIENISYNQSSKAFVAHVSWPIKLSGRRKGAITLAVRVEKLLTAD